MDKLLLRPTEAADLIGVGRSKIYELLGSGEIPSVRIGGSLRVPLQQLREWINSKTSSSSETSRVQGDRHRVPASLHAG